MRLTTASPKHHRKRQKTGTFAFYLSGVASYLLDTTCKTPRTSPLLATIGSVPGLKKSLHFFSLQHNLAGLIYPRFGFCLILLREKDFSVKLKTCPLVEWISSEVIIWFRRRHSWERTCKTFSFQVLICVGQILKRLTNNYRRILRNVYITNERIRLI